MRKENWELLLAEYLRQSESLSFQWGSNDCALWASRWVDVATGSEHAPEWEGQYDTAETAQAFMESRNFTSPEDIADAHLPIRDSIAYAKRGDLVLHPDGALGICHGRNSYFLLESRGLSAVRTNLCLKAWEV